MIRDVRRLDMKTAAITLVLFIVGILFMEDVFGLWTQVATIALDNPLRSSIQRSVTAIDDPHLLFLWQATSDVFCVWPFLLVLGFASGLALRPNRDLFAVAIPLGMFVRSLVRNLDWSLFQFSNGRFMWLSWVGALVPTCLLGITLARSIKFRRFPSFTIIGLLSLTAAVSVLSLSVARYWYNVLPMALSCVLMLFVFPVLSDRFYQRLAKRGKPGVATEAAS